MDYECGVEDDELDAGLRRPVSLDLEVSSFASGYEYVKSFVKETRILHKGDAQNDDRRSKSLGHVYHSHNLQPVCLRDRLQSECLYLTAIVPIL